MQSNQTLYWTLALTFVLAGCATPTKTLIGPDGTQHKLVSCGQVEECYERATGVCGGKYQIVNTSNETSTSGDANGVSGSTTTKLLIKCIGK